MTLTKTVSDELAECEEDATLLNVMVSRLGFEPRTLALKWPQGISKINALLSETFQSATWFYNGLQIGCPI